MRPVLGAGLPADCKPVECAEQVCCSVRLRTRPPYKIICDSISKKFMNILKDNKKLILCGCIVCALLLYSPLAAHAQTTDRLFNVSVILPGMTQSIDISQASVFPLGCPQFFIAVLGKGTLGISLRKDDVAGDLIFMTGVASSSAGTVPTCGTKMTSSTSTTSAPGAR